jgi:hypothetical protein
MGGSVIDHLRRCSMGLRQRELGRAARRYLAGSAIGAWFGSDIGVAAFGTAISGMVPGAVFGFLSTWLVYRYGKRAMGALLKYLKEVAIRGLEVLGLAARRYLAGLAIGAWFGSGVGIAAFGTAISGTVPGAILGFFSTWLLYRYGKRR